MRTRMVCLLTAVFVLILSSQSYGWSWYVINSAGSYCEHQTSGTAHSLWVNLGWDSAQNAASAGVGVMGDEWGTAVGIKDGYTTVYVADYIPGVDPQIELTYYYGLNAYVSFEGSNPGSGSAEALAFFYPGSYTANASLTYPPLYGTDAHTWPVYGQIDMSYSGAEMPLYGFCYADCELYGEILPGRSPRPAEGESHGYIVQWGLSVHPVE